MQENDRSEAPNGPVRPATQTDVKVSVSSLVKTFRREDGSVITPVDSVDLAVEAGEMVVLLGPSGCGKTTLLRCIAGLETPDTGQVTIGGRPVFDADRRLNHPTERREVSIVFQSYALWPHMTAYENVAFPLRTEKRPQPEIRERVARALAMVGVAELARQYPGQMSGGQQQRVALARAIVRGTDVVLFDEPLSNVDAKVREQLRYEIGAMQRELGFAGIYVTHDQDEALELADRVLVLKQGRIEQEGSPTDVYLRPASHYVARFVGTVNEVAGTVTALDGDAVTITSGEMEVTSSSNAVPTDERLEVGSPATAVWRPEAMRVSRGDGALDGNVWAGVLEDSARVGPMIREVVDVGSRTFRVTAFDREPIAPRTNVHVSVLDRDVQVFAGHHPDGAVVDGEI